uniref:Transmembrane protein 182-like n=1 Tax=Dromaius novaehollandiae TaxID=8790 RepID=A0A8C4KR04_DRONO
MILNFCQTVLTFHHEGFFWRCWFFGEGDVGTIWSFWYTHCCCRLVSARPSRASDSTPSAIIFSFLARLFPLLVGGFLLLCGLPFAKPRFYKAGGGFLLAAGKLSVLINLLYENDLSLRNEKCMDEVPVHVYYGWSFMFAAAGVPLALLSGLLFYLVGRDIMKSLE